MDYERWEISPELELKMRDMACAIPAFDPDNADHQELARLSIEAHAIVAETAFTGQVVNARRTSRAAVESQIAAIDEIARRLLEL